MSKMTTGILDRNDPSVREASPINKRRMRFGSHFGQSKTRPRILVNETS